jgi:ankyrin repeat protein
MPLLGLANDLLLHISDHLESERDTSAFARVNHYLYRLLNAYLYRHNVQRFGSSALLWAAIYGQKGTAQKSLREGANAQATTDNGLTPLFLAASNGHEALVELLLEQDGVVADSKDNHCRTPLLWAAEKGHEVVVKLLLAKDDVDPDSKDRWGKTPLSWAAENGHETVVKLLLAKDDVDPDSKDERSQTPLSWAAENGHETVVKLLLAMDGVDPDSKDTRGQTPLLCAVENGHEAVVKLLLAKDGADPNFNVRLGRTLLSSAGTPRLPGGFRLSALYFDPSRKTARKCAMAEEREVHVTSLDSNLHEEDLQDVFSKYGPVEGIRLLKTMRGESKGAAFVVFKEKKDAAAALALDKTKLKSKIMTVEMSTR